MATDSNQNTAGQQVVFIDSDVPDIQDLIAGLAPGVKAFVLNASSDGVEQIAGILAADDLTDLSSISLVGHGAAGEIQLGSSVLDTSDLSSESAALAQIGAALAPGGDLQLYACDTASGASGQQFIADLSQYAGGAAIAASSNLVGAVAEGGSWALNADIGSPDVASPFTAAATSDYSGLLSLNSNQIFFSAWNGVTASSDPESAGNRVEQFGVSGSTAIGGSDVDLVDGTQSANSDALGETTGIAVDTALNEYFVASYNTTTYEWTIQEGSASGGNLSTIYTDPLPSLGSNNAPGGGPITGTAVLLGGLALDAATNTLYFAQDAENYQNGDFVYADTGIYEVSLSGGAPTLLTPTNGSVFNPNYIALDASANLLFFTDSIAAADGFPADDNLDVANLTTGAVTVLKSFFSASDADDTVQGLAVSGNNIYVTTDASDASSSANAILSIPFTVSGSGSTATASAGAATTLYSGSGADKPTDIVVDAANGIFYTTGYEQVTVDSNPGDTATIFEGSLSGGSSLTPVLSMADVTGPITATSSPAFDTNARQLVLVTQPIVTAGATVAAGVGRGAVTLDSGATVSVTDGQNLAGATISGALGGDTLSFNGGAPETFADGDQISSSFSGGVLTLSGDATAANYQAALDSVTFATTSTDTTPRTLDWTVTDGIVASATANSTVDVLAAPTVTAGATGTFDGGGAPVTLDPGLTVSDASSATLASASVMIVDAASDDRLNFSNQNGISGNYDSSTGALSLTGVANLAAYQTALESISYSTSPSNSDPTEGGGDTSRTIDWTVDDGALSSTTATSSLIIVHEPPNVTAGGTVSFDGGGSAVTLDAALSVSDLDSSGSLEAAKVQIASGAIAGDTLNFSAQDGISGSFSGDTLTLAGHASIADYQAALESITYSFNPSNGDPTGGGVDTSRTIDWTVDDGVANSSVATSALDVVHEPPKVTAGGAPTYTEGGSAVTLDAAISVSDPDSEGLLAGATVQITSGYLSGDALTANTAGTAITASYNGDGLLTLSGSDPLAFYQQVLESVAYSSTAANPTDGGADATRTLTWTVDDGVSASATATSSVDIAVCYCRGTPVLTDKGEVAVERLSIGDIVVTASGENKPVRWIGWRDINCAAHPDPQSVWPVRIMAGAVAPGVPARDLSVSPEHSLFLDGALIPARLLVNGTTVVQERVVSVSYWHVELDRHDLLVAAGLAAESYLDCRNRNAFANGGSVAALHPDFSPQGEWREYAHWAQHSCAPRHLDGPVLLGVRQSLARRAVELGARATRDPGVQVLADGEVLTPVSVLDGCFCFEAPEDARSLRLRSRSAVLAQLAEADSAETRRLGVCATRIVVDGRDIALDAAELRDGWHEVEGEAPHQWRWSNGDAELPIGQTMALWLRPLSAAYPLPRRESVGGVEDAQRGFDRRGPGGRAARTAAGDDFWRL